MSEQDSNPCLPAYYFGHEVFLAFQRRLSKPDFEVNLSVIITEKRDTPLFRSSLKKTLSSVLVVMLNNL